MPLLNTADALYLGSSEVDAMYLGDTLVWPEFVMPSGTLGWWDQSTLAVADGGAVSTWTDRSGNGHDLVLQSGNTAPLYSASMAALTYPGGAARELAVSNLTPTANSPFTQVFVALRGTTEHQNITGMGVGAARQMIDLMGYGSTFIGHMHGGGNDTINNSPPPFPADGAFHTAVATYDGINLNTSLDGVASTSWVGPLGLQAGPFRVGNGAYPQLGNTRNGSAVRGVALFDRVLTPEEIDSVAAALGGA